MIDPGQERILENFASAALYLIQDLEYWKIFVKTAHSIVQILASILSKLQHPSSTYLSMRFHYLEEENTH